jgi:hypothetical protein
MRSFRELRRALRAALPHDVPLAPPGATLDYAALPTEPPRLEHCDLLEDSGTSGRLVPGAFVPGFTAFLDGIQETQAVTYVGSIPLVGARVAAVIRERVDRRLTTWEGGVRESVRLYAPRDLLSSDVRAAIERGGSEIVDTLAGQPQETLHPLELLRCALQVVKNHREALEQEVAEAWCLAVGKPLYVDGGLPRGPRSASSDCCAGVVKSHHTLYVGAEGLRTIVALRAGMRTGVFVVERSRRASVASWYLRVRDGATGGDPMWGLVRVEIALLPELANVEALSHRADEVSRWILAERTPLALPDGRWDREAYGVRDCEEYLRSIAGG